MILHGCFGACALALLLASAGFAPMVSARGQVSAPQRTEARPYFYEPAVSPDRSEIAFVSGGDVWTVPASGGEARLLVSHPATEYRPTYSPDGRRLAFTSARTGNGDVYVLALDTGELRQLTYDDGFDQVESWSPDGRWVYFSTTAREISGNADVLRVSAEGGTPMTVSGDRYVNEFMSAPSPDGAHLAFTGRGFSQWWRRGRSHIDESEIWLMRDHSTSGYEQLTEGGAKELWPMWSADGRSIFYVSDRSGADNLWVKPFGGRARQVTQFKAGRVLWPSISRDGRAIVFERDFKIWKLDTESGRAAEVPITRLGSAAVGSVERLRMTDQFQELSLAPDGKKVAFVARGEVFAASSTDGGDAVRVTTTPGPESQVSWSHDSRRLVYVSERNGSSQIFTYEFGTNRETALTTASGGDAHPRFSPDGKWLAFERGGRELRVLDLASKQERVLAKGSFERPPLNSDRPFVWSPDSRWIAFRPVGSKLFRNVFVVPLEGGEPRQVSFLANVFNNTVSWSPDGTYLLFDTWQRTEVSQVARVDLMPRVPRFREDQFRDLFREETPRTTAPTLRRPDNDPNAPVPPRDAPGTTPTPPPPPTPLATPTPSPQPGFAGGQGGAPKRVEIVFDGIRQRLSLLPVGVSVLYQTISPDGKNLLMVASVANQTNLYLYSLDELSREPAVARQITSTPGGKSYAQFSPDGREVFYLEQGRIQVVPVDQRQPPRTLSVAAELDADFSREKFEIFQQGWEYLRDNFYDPGYHGVNWQTTRDAYRPYVAGAQNSEEVRRLMRLMVGELNASHLGVSAPPGSSQTITGRIGVGFDREEYERNGHLRVTSVVPLSPAALARDAANPDRTREIKPGDYLLAVDGRHLDSRTNLDQLLNYKINRRVALTVATSPAGADRRELEVRPVNLSTEKGLRYRQWVENNRAYVARVSGGRLGYVHMFDMSSASLSQLYADLDAENQSREGVVFDLRNNNGGFVNVYAIDVLARRSYLRMTPRGFDAAPGRTYLGQRALELPTILVTNQYSLSDAEDFTEGYRSLRLGKVVGEPTSGWIIYTSNVSLLDGTVFRIPFMRVEDNAGQNMELNPRQVDVPVRRPIGESYVAKDVQLDTAVRELLKGIGAGTK